MAADGKTCARRSQMGRVVFLGDPEIWDGDVAHAHVISWQSQIISRMRRSTMQAETQSAAKGVGGSIYIVLHSISAAVADMRGELESGCSL
jgi:hypothetical protein